MEQILREYLLEYNTVTNWTYLLQNPINTKNHKLDFLYYGTKLFKEKSMVKNYMLSCWSLPVCDLIHIHEDGWLACRFPFPAGPASQISSADISVVAFCVSLIVQKYVQTKKKGQTWNESYLLPPLYVSVLFYGPPLHCDLRCPMRYSSALHCILQLMKWNSEKIYKPRDWRGGAQSSKWFVGQKQVSFLFWRSLFLLAGSIQDFGRKSSRTAYVYVGDSSFVSVRTKTGFFWNEKKNSGILNKLKIGKCE